ncbi:MAG: hypothetical protein WCZ23_09170 [Rhodospirillaceae bacterium]
MIETSQSHEDLLEVLHVLLRLRHEELPPAEVSQLAEQAVTLLADAWSGLSSDDLWQRYAAERAKFERY